MTRLRRAASSLVVLPTVAPARPVRRRDRRSELAGLAIAAALVLTAGSLGCEASQAEGLVVPRLVDRGGSIDAVYRFDGPITGHGFIDAEWTDVLGRVVERRRIALDLAGKAEARFSFDPSRAVTAKNRLVVNVSLAQTDRSGKPVEHQHADIASFVVTPPDSGWSDYQIIMWQRQTPAGYAALKRLGVTAGMVESDHQEEPGNTVRDQIDALLDADMRWYLENIATDFFSPYHRWTSGRPVDWRFREVKRRYRENPADPAAFVREPSLSDPRWLGAVADRLAGNVRALRGYRPLFYNLADEPGIADLSAFWDFDLSATSLAAMRQWLKRRYGDLARLNDEWGTAFAGWDDVVPMLTREAIGRTDQNFASWADFKEWMDVAFAQALKRATDAVHAADPAALAAIEGVQIPGWGGYDYARLAASTDAMELDDVDMMRSLNPDAVLLTTSFGRGAAETHRLWRELLRGTRGLILWDRGNQFVGKDGSIGERGREAAPFFKEVRAGIGALLVNSRKRADPVAILHSPASMRIEWLLDRKPEGEAWSRRSASSELEDTSIRVSERNYARAIRHLGLQYRFVSHEQVERGELAGAGYRALILPRTIALSAPAAAAIRDFVGAGGTVIADGEPGIFDEHGRRLARSALADIFPPAMSRSATRFASGKGAAIYLASPEPRDRGGAQRLSGIFAGAGIEPLVSLTQRDGRPAADVETYVFENGGTTIVALLRDLDRSSPMLEDLPDRRQTIDLRLPRPYQIYDVRAHRALGLTQRLTLGLGPVAPVVLAVSDRPPPGLSIVGPRKVRAGEEADFRISPDPVSAGAAGIIHVEVADPEGNVVPYYSGNRLASEGAARYRLPLAVNDRPGLWTIRADAVLTGGTATAQVEVEP